MRRSVAVIFLLSISIFLPHRLLAEGKVADLKNFAYWDNGKVRECTILDTEGHTKARAVYRNDGTVEKIEKFDINGNKVEEVLYDQKGKLKGGIDGWAARRWKYDGYQLMSQITYDEYGRPIDKKYYSESGKLIARQYRDSDDANLNPYEEANMQMLLGPANMRYYDPGKKVDDGVPLVKE